MIYASLDPLATRGNDRRWDWLARQHLTVPAGHGRVTDATSEPGDICSEAGLRPPTAWPAEPGSARIAPTITTAMPKGRRRRRAASGAAGRILDAAVDGEDFGQANDGKNPQNLRRSWIRIWIRRYIGTDY